MSGNPRGNANRGSFRGAGNVRGNSPYRGNRGDSRGGAYGGAQGLPHRPGPAAASDHGPGDANVRYSGPGIYKGSLIPAPDHIVERLENALIANTKARDLTAEIPTRPGYGGLPGDRNILLRVNYFNLNVDRDGIELYRYNVATMDSKQQEEQMAKGKRRQFMLMLLRDPKFGNTIRASDNSAIVVTTRPLDIHPDGWEGKLLVTRPGEDAFPPESSTEPQQLRKARARNTVHFRVKASGRLNLGELMKYLKSDQPNAHFEDAEPLIQMLNIMICRGPNEDQGMINLGSNQFFPLPGNTLQIRERMDLGNGLEAHRGYFSSVRPATGRLLINLNIKSGAFYQSGDLRTLVQRFCGTSTPDFQNSHRMQELEAFLLRLKVETNYLRSRDAHGKVLPGPTKKKVHTIQGFALLPPYGTARTVTFSFADGHGGPNTTMTVERYFREHNNMPLKYADEPVLMVGSQKQPSFLPMELCSVLPGQPVRRMLNGPQTSAMLKFAARRPNQNAESIEGIGSQPGFALKCFRLDAAAQATSLNPIGLSVDDKMITVSARILNPPRLEYKVGVRMNSADPRFGAWNLSDKTFRQGGRFRNFAALAINYENETAIIGSVKELDDITKEFVLKMNGYGIRFDQQGRNKVMTLQRPTRDTRTQINNALTAAFQGAVAHKYDILLVILNDSDTWLYSRIKFYCDCKAGIHTVCSIGNKFCKRDPMLWGNLALKLNIKGGGVNHIIKPTELAQPAHFDNKTMLMGIDVTHPSPGSMEGAPSIAAVVASINTDLSQWPGSVVHQESKSEMVVGLQRLVSERLECWQRFNNRDLPNKIIVYRDGVSEGQFDLVLRNELVAIRAACQAKYIDRPIPRLTLIVCNKRHNTRAFPTTEIDSDAKNGYNCKPGTVFDRGVTQPKYWEFFLQAHGSLQGSAKSARYIVLLDNIGFGKDEIQKFTHNLSYLFNRATKAVSVCPPAYYADLLCERGRAYLYSTMMENTTRGGEFNGATAEWTENCHRNLANSTFYI